MTIVDGWVQWAVKAPGIPDKIYTQRNKGLGLIGHSIVGSYESAMSRFLSEERDLDGRYSPYASASVMFVCCYDGTLIQMYDVFSSTWTSGGREANTSFWAIELEGGPPGNTTEPATDAQVATLLRLCDEFTVFTGRAIEQGVTFREHGEVARQYGYAPTACPSRRYTRLYEALEERNDGMTPEQVETIAETVGRRIFDEAYGAYFKASIEAYFANPSGFTAPDGTPITPIKPWLDDVVAAAAPGDLAARVALLLENAAVELRKMK